MCTRMTKGGERGPCSATYSRGAPGITTAGACGACARNEKLGCRCRGALGVTLQKAWGLCNTCAAGAGPSRRRHTHRRQRRACAAGSGGRQHGGRRGCGGATRHCAVQLVARLLAVLQSCACQRSKAILRRGAARRGGGGVRVVTACAWRVRRRHVQSPWRAGRRQPPAAPSQCPRRPRQQQT